DLELDLLDLRVHLIQLHAGPRDRGLLRAEEQRIADIELRRPAREVRVQERRQRVAISAGDAADRRTVYAAAALWVDVLRATKPDETVRADEIDLRPELIVEVLERDV